MVVRSPRGMRRESQIIYPAKPRERGAPGWVSGIESVDSVSNARGEETPRISVNAIQMHTEAPRTLKLGVRMKSLPISLLTKKLLLRATPFKYKDRHK